MNGHCIEADGSMLPSKLDINPNDEFLGVILSVTDYHGTTTSFVTSKEELEKIGIILVDT